MATKKHERADLRRSVPFTRAADDDHGDGRTFTGYGAVFNSPTRIDSWEGRFDEQFAPGAFRKTIRERTPKFQFDHGHHSLIGSVPIGTINSLIEDERGLLVEARLGKHLFIDFIQEAIETGAIDGMSIRFSVVREEWRDENGIVVPPTEVDDALWTGERGILLRTIQEAKLAEVGPVVWPAYKDTTAGVRSMEPVTIDPSRLNEPGERRRLAELLFRAEEQDAQQGEPSNDEPQDPAGDVDVEHSGEDVEESQSTDEAAEHESDKSTDDPEVDDDGDEVDATRAAEIDRLYDQALAEVVATRDSTPPII